jgi:hypothetical protein
VSCVGAGLNATTIKGGKFGAGKAVLRWSLPVDANNYYMTFGGMTIDAAGADFGVYMRDCSILRISHVRIKNAAQWSMRTTRFLDCSVELLVCAASDNDIDPATSAKYPTQNGIYLADADPLEDDEATTVCVFTGLWIEGVPGTGLEIQGWNSFGMQFNGGTIEGCGKPVVLGPDSRSITFNSTDFEATTGDGLDIDGLHHRFNNCSFLAATLAVKGGDHTFDNCEWNSSTTTLTGAGGHRLLNMFRPGTVTDNCTGPTLFDVATAYTGWQVPTGTNPYTTVHDDGKWWRRNQAQRTIASSAATATLSLLTVGDAASYFVQVRGGNAYLLGRTGGITTLDAAACEAAIAQGASSAGFAFESGGNIRTGGNLIVGNLSVFRNGANVVSFDSLDGAGVVGLRLSSHGSAIGYVVQDVGGGDLYFTTGDTLPDYNTATLAANSFLHGNAAGDATVRRKLAVGGNVGFNGTAPIAKPTLNAAATDAATTQALVNQIRAALINYGLAV